MGNNLPTQAKRHNPCLQRPTAWAECVNFAPGTQNKTLVCDRGSQEADWSRGYRQGSGGLGHCGYPSREGLEEHPRCPSPQRHTSPGAPRTGNLVPPALKRPDPCDEPDLPAPNLRLHQGSWPLNRPEPIFRNRHVSNPNGLIYQAVLQCPRTELKSPSSRSAPGFGNSYAV